MNRVDYLNNLRSPVSGARLKKWPKGDVMQFWSENPALYSASFNQLDPIHSFLGGHSGIDIAGKHRTPIVAAHDGTAIAVGTKRDAVGGLILYIESPVLDGEQPGNSRISTAYAHLDEIIVAVGQKVNQGDLVGYMGNTGFVISGGTKYWGNAPAGVGTHLHFGLYEFKKDQFGNWQPRYPNKMMNSSDPLPYISDATPDDGKIDGELGGLTSALNNILKYIDYLRGRSA